MLSVNKAIIIGNIGKDPELRHTENGTAVLKFSVATTNKWKDKEGEWQEKTDWHNIVVFGKKAETVNEFLKKGTPVYIEGRIQTDVVEKEDGDRRWYTSIVGNVVIVLSRKSDNEEPSDVSPETTSDSSDDDNSDLPF